MTRRRRSVGGANDGKQAVLPLDSPTKATPLLPPAADARDAIIADLRAQLVAANARAERAEARADRMEGRLEQMMAKLDRIEAANEQLASAAVTGEFANLEVSEMIDRYLVSEKRRLEEGGSWQATRARLNAIKKHIGKLVVKRVSLDAADLYIDKRAGDITHLGKPPKRDSITQELFALNRVFNWCIERRKLNHNPIHGFEQKRTPARRKTRYSPEDVERMLAVANPYLRAWILCTYDCGLRPGETRLLERSQINWGTGHLSLRHDQDKENDEHDVFLTERTLAALRALPTPLAHKKLFTNPETGKLWGKTTYIAWWDKAAEEVGLEGAPDEKPIFYVLRHTLSDDMADANVPVQTAAAVMRHKDWRMQQRHYYSRRLKQIGEALGAVDELRRERLPAKRNAAAMNVSEGVRKPPRRSDHSEPQAKKDLDSSK